MKQSLFLSIAIVLAVSAAARADDASDCNRAVQAPEAAIPACTRMLDRANAANARKILLLRSRAYTATKQFDAAFADVAQMAAVAPANLKYTAVFARGYIHDAMKDYDAEVADYDEVLSKDPKNYIALSNRCSAVSRSPRYADQALADCNVAIAAFGDKPGPDIITRGLVYLRLGRFKDALSDYDLAIANNWVYPQSYYGRGIAKLKLGDVEGGKADVANAIAIKSDIADEFSPLGLVP